MTIKESEHIMISKFSVENFKGFKDKIILDLSKSRDYNFNSALVKNKIVNKAIIYGKNGEGKSNLGLAMYDLVTHLTDKQKSSSAIAYMNYTNLNSGEKIAKFQYEFMFDGLTYVYSYAKTQVDQLVYETIETNDTILLHYDYSKKDKNVINIKGMETLQIELPDNRLSVLKYIYRNTPSNDSVITKIIKFAEGMLWFRCLKGNDYIGLVNGSTSMDEIVIQNNKVIEFEKFLSTHGINYKLEARTHNNQNVLYVKFKNGYATLASVMSTGTSALWLYFCWSIFFDNVSFLFLDEFDAFYHYEASEMILKLIFSNSNMQSIVTSHNTYLMKNSITRPDSCFILSKGQIHALCDCTDKEIREAHNLEKMYRNGAFIE